jgi:hypothetical protein
MKSDRRLCGRISLVSSWLESKMSKNLASIYLPLRIMLPFEVTNYALCLIKVMHNA